MEPFTTLTAVAAPMDRANIDTDQIIPARFLRKPRSEGYHNWLFNDVRLNPDGSENPEFVLNQPAYRAAQIVVAAENFGCGSSREGAVWALTGRGTRAVIAQSFGDIFFNNALKNGLLPIILKPEICASLRAQLHAAPGTTITIDLESQTVTGPDGEQYRFEIDPFRKQCLLTGQDEIGLTLSYAGDIDRFEAGMKRDLPFLATAAR